jgi:hypothetical protein
MPPARDVVIELDTSIPWPPPDARPRGPRSPVGAAVAVFLTVALLLTGPTALRPDALSPAWRTATSTAYYWLAGTGLYTLDRADGRIRLTAHDLETGDVRWSRALTGTLADVYARNESFMSSNFPPDATTGVRTNVVARQGGLPRLAFPTAALPMAYVGSRVALVIDRDPQRPPRPDADGPTRAMGLEWTYVATAYDLGTGEPRWRLRLAPGVRWALPGVRAGAEGVVGLPPGRDWMVTSSTGGDVRIRDIDTGRELSRHAFGALKQQAFVVALADEVLVRLDGGDGASLDAFDPPALTPRWRFVPPIADAEPVACEPLLCLADNRSVWIVDPADGRTVWRPIGPLMRPGPAGRLVVTGYGNQLVLYDTRDLRPIPVDPGWRVVDYSAYTRFVVVVRVHAVGGTADLGLLDVATGTVRRLGRVPRWSPTTRCLAAAGHIACADATQVRLWRVEA